MNLLDPKVQSKDLVGRTIAALDKLSDGMKFQLLQQQKQSGLTPLQIKIILFVASHEPSLNTVSQLVKELLVTKATISDSIKSLEKKGLVRKQLDYKDNRSFSIQLTEKGKKICEELGDYISPFQKSLVQIEQDDLARLYNNLFGILKNLDDKGAINLNRSCNSCKNYRTDGINHAFCMELRMQIKPFERRMDCTVYKEQKTKVIL
ncbi:MAG: hypothetical protein CL868_19240 [Cytophagaceae bacterium]|nr:hypothetical protein [Cytophagaceae bacterium]|tara:strand:- start:32454 stop:33071 length:618 start_codon:yes stop_codon:yes gene_type:complete